MARKSMLVYFAVMLCTYLFLPLARADEIILDNGNRFTGTMAGLAGDYVTVSSDYAEPIKVKKAHIIRIPTDNSVELHLSDGEIIRGKLKVGADGRVIVDRGDGLIASGIDFKGVTASIPPFREMAREHRLVFTDQLVLANVLDYVNDPPAGIKSTDSNFTVGLQYAF